MDERFEEAEALWDEGDLPAAIETYDAIVRDLEDADVVEAQEAIAQALILKAEALHDLERFDEAHEAFDLVFERFSDAEDSELEAQVARALVQKTWALMAEGRFDRAAAVADAIIVRYEAASDSDVRSNVAHAFTAQVECLGELRRLEEAIDVARALDRFADGAFEPDLVERAMRARYNEAVFLGRLGRNDEALLRYRSVIDDPVAQDGELIAEIVLRAAWNAANTLWGLRRADEAESLLAGAIGRFDDEPGPDARVLLSLTLDARARMFVLEGRWDEAIRVSDQIIDMAGSGEARDLRLMLAHALHRKGLRCWAIGDFVEYAAVQRSLFDRFWDDPDEDLRHLAATSAEECTGALCRLGKGLMLLELLQTMTSRFEESDDQFLWARGFGARVLGNMIRPAVRLGGDPSHVLMAYSAAGGFAKRAALACRTRLP